MRSISATMRAQVIVDATATPPVLGPLGVAFVDALYEYEDKNGHGPSWYALSVAMRQNIESVRRMGEALREVGVVTWSAERYSLAVVGRYREVA